MSDWIETCEDCGQDLGGNDCKKCPKPEGEEP